MFRSRARQLKYESVTSLHTTIQPGVRTRPSTPRRPTSPMSRRMKLFRTIFILIFLLLGTRLFALQIQDHAQYAKISVNQVQENLTTSALRAGIYDRYGQILAVSRPTSLVIADDLQITNPLKEAKAMSPIVKMPVSQLTPLLSKKSGYVIINNALDLTDGHKLSSLGFPGVVVEDSSVRS